MGFKVNHFSGSTAYTPKSPQGFPLVARLCRTSDSLFIGAWSWEESERSSPGLIPEIRGRLLVSNRRIDLAPKLKIGLQLISHLL
jgi:hypothetical protein